MKAISIKQPWAHFIAEGIKTIELRSWQTKYRGQLLIVSSLNPAEILKKFKETDSEGRNKVQDLEYPDFDYMYFGRAICICDLYQIEPFTKKNEKAALYGFHPGLFAWRLRNIQRVKPIPIKGKLNFFEVDDDQIVVL